MRVLWVMCFFLALSSQAFALGRAKWTLKKPQIDLPLSHPARLVSERLPVRKDVDLISDFISDFISDNQDMALEIFKRLDPQDLLSFKQTSKNNRATLRDSDFLTKLRWTRDDSLHLIPYQLYSDYRAQKATYPLSAVRVTVKTPQDLVDFISDPQSQDFRELGLLVSDFCPGQGQAIPWTYLRQWKRLQVLVFKMGSLPRSCTNAWLVELLENLQESPKLQTLKVFTDLSIPPVDEEVLKKIAQIGSLVHLNLQKVNLTKEKGLEPLLGLKHLKELSLSFLGNTDFKVLSEFRNLKDLGLDVALRSSLGLSLQESSALSNLRSLENLRIRFNTGFFMVSDEPFFDAIRSLRKLRKLTLESVHLDVDKARLLAQLPQLTHLKLFYNRFDTGVIESLCSSTSLSHLSLFFNPIGKEEFVAFGQCQALRFLELLPFHNKRELRPLFHGLYEQRKLKPLISFGDKQVFIHEDFSSEAPSFDF